MAIKFRLHRATNIIIAIDTMMYAFPSVCIQSQATDYSAAIYYIRIIFLFQTQWSNELEWYTFSICRTFFLPFSGRMLAWLMIYANHYSIMKYSWLCLNGVPPYRSTHAERTTTGTKKKSDEKLREKWATKSGQWTPRAIRARCHNAYEVR